MRLSSGLTAERANDLALLVSNIVADTLELLRDRLKLVEETIAALERHLPAARSKRGRKSIGEAERLQISERMLKYWAGRRSETTGPSKK